MDAQPTPVDIPQGELLTARYLLAGSESLLDASLRLELEARRLRDLHQRGYTLGPVSADDRRAVIIPPANGLMCLDCGQVAVPAGHDLCDSCATPRGRE